MSLNPLEITESIKENYINYLTTTFKIKDENLEEQFKRLLNSPGRFIKGPILEATPSFKAGKTIEEIVREGILSKEFRKLNTNVMPIERPLYSHQEKAIRKIVSNDRNVVIATGTGSGKTEAFLVPILDYLFKEKERGELGPGVRALLLYPMNALANDQLKRMGEVLRNYEEITFGRFTGETEKEYKKALDRYWEMNDRKPSENELISREQMRKTPPNILLTNYAMLEYLLLRPEDNVFFDGKDAEFWKFIVLDEAHTYSGAKGIETAMLLRRLKDRVVESKKGRLRCIATSATLGDDISNMGDITNFAKNLFGETFEWIENDKNRQDVINAEKLPLVKTIQPWGEGDSLLYLRWKYIIDRGDKDNHMVENILKVARETGVPNEVIKKAAEHEISDYRNLINHVLVGDKRVIKLQEMLEKEPLYLYDAAREIFGDKREDVEKLVALIDIGAKAKKSGDGIGLIPARYHFFVRAIEGAYIKFFPQKEIFLERREEILEKGMKQKVFEIGICRQCGSIYLVGETTNEGDQTIFGQPAKNSIKEPGKLEYYLVLDKADLGGATDEDELVESGKEDAGTGEEIYKLCTSCGAIDRENSLFAMCHCDPANYIRVLKVKSKDGVVYRCPACKKQSSSGIVRRFLVGNDASASVLATTLYQNIAPKKMGMENDKSRTDYDEWAGEEIENEEGRQKRISYGGGRQLLIFSDNRQDAAFFAPYLNRTYSRIIRRKLILETLRENKDSVLENKWRLQDLIEPIKEMAEDLNIFKNMELYSQEEKKRETWRWILFEFLSINRGNSLEELGLLGFSIVMPEKWSVPTALLGDPWNLDEGEAKTLFRILLDNFRTKGAVALPEILSPDDEFFKPRNRQFYFRENESSIKKGIYSWTSYKGNRMNSRVDYLMRLMRKGIKNEISEDSVRNVLRKIWERSLGFGRERDSRWSDYFEAKNIKGEGTVQKIKYNFWEIRNSEIDKKVQWYYCDKCHRLTLLNIRNVCPTYGCEGKLRAGDPEEILKSNHYRNIYRNIKPIPLVAREHTAQLTSDAAAKLQAEFIQGKVNVLSCSTTFELGVDVGELESVFMRNVPPTSANYIQRAGRAGRRTDSAAFALTFAKLSSHDLTHFKEPEKIVKGTIKAPYFKLENKKIVKRHIYATALADFLKEARSKYSYKTVGDFFFGGKLNGCGLFENFLIKKPIALKKEIERIIPIDLEKELDIENWGWVNGLFEESEGVLKKAEREVVSDIQELEKVKSERAEKGKPTDYILRSINTIKNRYLINFLSSKNVIPKYGFPVDVVELQILGHTKEAGMLELSRDLKIAISEYAPSSQIVAGGKLWTSRYLKRLPKKEWPRYRYAVCDYCHSYQSMLADTNKKIDTCAVCHRPISGRNQGEFVVPEFGFIVSNEKPQRPGDEKPRRTYSTRTYFSGKAKEGEKIELQLRNVKLIATPASDGILAVINHAGYQGFKVCYKCGYAILGSEKTKKEHKTPWGGECNGKLKSHMFLGHEFKSDTIKLYFEGIANEDDGFWLSLLYAIIEGASEGLEIDRQDLDGCLYPATGDPRSQTLILFDNVPGGAGHVNRMAKKRENLEMILRTALKKLDSCDCGGPEGNSSCYSCLRNYYNQYCHDKLNRGVIIRFLKDILP